MNDYAPPDQERPLGGYAVLTGVFNAGVVAAAVALSRSKKELPERYPLSDVLLTGAATHKIARLITKEKVTTFIRAPFTRYQGKGAPAEVEEAPRGTGLQRAIGELLVCPYCVGLWIATAFAFGLATAPRGTRMVAGVFASLGISDFLQIAYKAAEEKGL